MGEFINRHKKYDDFILLQTIGRFSDAYQKGRKVICNYSQLVCPKNLKHGVQVFGQNWKNIENYKL
jgi:hypothetical protein